MEELKTAHGQLAIASEYRFVYWGASYSYAFYTVARGRRHLEGRWGILDGGEFGTAWNGSEWVSGSSQEKFPYTDLEEALVTARRLAVEENQRIVEAMERRFPGQFRGSEFDLAAKENIA